MKGSGLLGNWVETRINNCPAAVPKVKNNTLTKSWPENRKLQFSGTRRDV
jgi:hypothetical protein